MKRRNSSDDDLRAAFVDRLAATPEPPAAMFERTLAGLRATPAPDRPLQWSTAARWWLALAAPARLALAAAIVIVGGTLAFGTVKATRIPAAITASSVVTIDRRPAHLAPQLAQTGLMQVAVRDVPAAVHSVVELARAKGGSIVPATSGARDSMVKGATRMTLQLPAGRLVAAMDAIGMLGAVRARSVHSVDLAAVLHLTAGQLEEARRAAPLTANALGHVAHLSALAERLENRIDTATLAVTIVPGLDRRAALPTVDGSPVELSQLGARRTGVKLARRFVLATDDTVVFRCRADTFVAAASSRYVARPFGTRTTT